MSSNKTIAKNTIFMYFRMFITLGVALFTSRIILETLGVNNFGIYNLVGGVVLMFSFLNAAMNSATQRFINIEKASDNQLQINKIFNISITNHVLISIIVLILAETIGLWFLNTKLNIPDNRIYAANIVYQLSIFTTIIDILRVPYNAIILAFEKMSFYAYIGIFETISKLIIVYLLILFPNNDQLIIYAILILLINLIVNIIIYFFCKKNFNNETSFNFISDISKIKELLFFSGWMLLGQVAVMFSTQGISIILNIFYGVAVNASLGIANQVNGAVYSFVTNFQVAFNPQIIQTYANGEIERNKTLILSSSKYSFFLIIILASPILYYTNSILLLWLGNNVPEYLVGFVQVVIICTLLDSLAGPFWMSASAIGNMKQYNIILTIINLFTLPVIYILLKMGVNPSIAYLGRFATYFVMQVYRYYFVNKYLNFNRNELIKYFSGIINLTILIILLISITNNTKVYTLFQIIIGTTLIEITIITIVYLFGLDKSEKLKISLYIENLKKNYLHKKSSTL